MTATSSGVHSWRRLMPSEGGEGRGGEGKGRVIRVPP